MRRQLPPSQVLEDVPPQLEHPAHHANGDLHASTRDIDDTAYRHVPCLREDGVWMAARVGDRAPFIGTRRVALSGTELGDRHIRHLHARGTLAVETQTLGDS